MQTAYATLLLESNNRSGLELARDKWRDIARKSQQRGELWYQAKYSIALAHYRLGDKQRAAEMIRLVQAVPPGLQTTELKKDFLALLDKCKE